MDSKPSENENSESSDVEECGYSTSTSDESYVEEKEERGIKLMHKKELGESSDSDEETVLSFKEHMAAGSDILKAIFTEHFQTVIAFLNEHPNGDWGTLHDIAPLHISDALYWACYFGHVKSVKLLLEYGANPLKYPPHCYAQGPVVHGACYGGLEVLKTVTEWVLQRRSGCVRRFVNARDRFTNSTALHIATKLQEIDMVIYLMRHGADLCGKDQNHKYPFEYAPAGSRLSAY